jgi:hypothetical protein
MAHDPRGIMPFRLRGTNRIFETTAWAAYRTEYDATYDDEAVGIANHEKAMK